MIDPTTGREIADVGALDIHHTLGNALTMLGYPRTTQVAENPAYIRGVVDYITLAHRLMPESWVAFVAAMQKLPKDRFYFMIDSRQDYRLLVQNYNTMSEYLTTSECELLDRFKTAVDLDLRQVFGIA